MRKNEPSYNSTLVSTMDRIKLIWINYINNKIFSLSLGCFSKEIV